MRKNKNKKQIGNNEENISSYCPPPVAVQQLRRVHQIQTRYRRSPDGLYGEEIATFTESTDGSPVAPEDSLDLGLGGMDWHELFTDPHLQALIGQGLQNNTDYQLAQLRVEEAEATLLSAKLAFLPFLCPCTAGHGEQL